MVTITFREVEIIIHIVIAFVFLADFFKLLLPSKVYIFFIDHRDILLGLYYVYLAFKVYKNIEITTPITGEFPNVTNR